MNTPFDSATYQFGKTNTLIGSTPQNLRQSSAFPSSVTGQPANARAVQNSQPSTTKIMEPKVDAVAAAGTVEPTPKKISRATISSATTEQAANPTSAKVPKQHQKSVEATANIGEKEPKPNAANGPTIIGTAAPNTLASSHGSASHDNNNKKKRKLANGEAEVRQSDAQGPAPETSAPKVRKVATSDGYLAMLHRDALVALLKAEMTNSVQAELREELEPEIRNQIYNEQWDPMIVQLRQELEPTIRSGLHHELEAEVRGDLERKYKKQLLKEAKAAVADEEKTLRSQMQAKHAKERKDLRKEMAVERKQLNAELDTEREQAFKDMRTGVDRALRSELMDQAVAGVQKAADESYRDAMKNVDIAVDEDRAIEHSKLEEELKAHREQRYSQTLEETWEDVQEGLRQEGAARLMAYLDQAFGSTTDSENAPNTTREESLSPSGDQAATPADTRGKKRSREEDATKSESTHSPRHIKRARAHVDPKLHGILDENQDASAASLKYTRITQAVLGQQVRPEGSEPTVKRLVTKRGFSDGAVEEDFDGQDEEFLEGFSGSAASEIGHGDRNEEALESIEKDDIGVGRANRSLLNEMNQLRPEVRGGQAKPVEIPRLGDDYFPGKPSADSFNTKSSSEDEDSDHEDTDEDDTEDDETEEDDVAQDDEQDETGKGPEQVGSEQGDTTLVKPKKTIYDPAETKEMLEFIRADEGVDINETDEDDEEEEL